MTTNRMRRLADPQADLAEMPGLFHIAEALPKFIERKHAIDHRAHLALCSSLEACFRT